MKFLENRKYRPINGNIFEVVKYLTTDLQIFLSNLVIGLTKLQIDDNFNGWVQEVFIPFGEEVKINNRLGEIISYKIVLRGKDGAQNIVDGDSEWTREAVYLKNTGLTDVSVMVAFLK